MKLGKYPEDETEVRLELDIFCTNCGKKVPGGIKTGKKYSETPEFKKELQNLLENYLCGICRDKKRISKD